MLSFELAKHVGKAVLRRLATATASGIVASACTSAPDFVKGKIVLGDKMAIAWAILWIVFETTQKTIRTMREP
jgi:hypothetical protein